MVSLYKKHRHSWKQAYQFRALELRKMLSDQDPSKTELEAAASLMQHSRLTQSKIYDQYDLKVKTKLMAPISETDLKAAASLMQHSQLMRSKAYE